MTVEAENRVLRELSADAREVGRLALDTEFMGEGRYRTLLCLVQLAVPTVTGQGERIEVIDPLERRLDGAPLARVLADAAVEVIVHAGRQDIALVRRRFGTEVRNVFDTQLAAGFVGLGAQASYESLLAEVLAVRVGKSASFTRWDTRPLTTEQRAYACEDVAHLLELADALEARLAELGRIEWARQECVALERSSDERDVETILARLPRVRRLSATAQSTARELVAWRERTAARQDRPAQSVLSDPALLEIAKRRPSSRAELERIRGAGANSGRRRAQELLDVVADARGRPAQPLPELPQAAAPRSEDAPLIALSEALVRARAREAGIAFELLAGKADLQAIVAARRLGQAEPEVRTLTGWRRELVGEELLRLLDGRLSLSVAGTALRAEARSGAPERQRTDGPGRAG